MNSALKTWRANRREATYWAKARDRSIALREGQIIAEVDVALMVCGQHISRYRSTTGRENQLDQLREVRLHLEAALGMMDNVLK